MIFLEISPLKGFQSLEMYIKYQTSEVTHYFLLFTELIIKTSVVSLNKPNEVYCQKLCKSRYDIVN